MSFLRHRATRALIIDGPSFRRSFTVVTPDVRGRGRGIGTALETAILGRVKNGIESSSSGEIVILAFTAAQLSVAIVVEAGLEGVGGGTIRCRDRGARGVGRPSRNEADSEVLNGVDGASTVGVAGLSGSNAAPVPSGIAEQVVGRAVHLARIPHAVVCVQRAVCSGMGARLTVGLPRIMTIAGVASGRVLEPACDSAVDVHVVRVLPRA